MVKHVQYVAIFRIVEGALELLPALFGAGVFKVLAGLRISPSPPETP